MSALENARHERFAQELAKGRPAGRAYEAAGYDASGPTADQAASRLLSTNIKVRERVTELQNKAAGKAEITLESWIKEGAELMRTALQNGDSAAASQQYERVAKVAGFWTERVESTQTLRTVSADPVTEDEWREQHAPPHAMN